MTATLILGLASTMVATAFLSGIFGMAGGLVLMGVLLALLPLPAAMALHAVTQMASNGWRAFLWRRFVQWPIFAGYLVGSVAAFALMKVIAFVPDKATLDWIRRSDQLEFIGDRYIDRAVVLTAAGRQQEAHLALQEAVNYYRGKGVVPSVRATHELRAGL